MGRRKRSLTEHEPHDCPKCGAMIPRSEGGLMLIYSTGEERGICSSCVRQHPGARQQIDKAVGVLVRGLAKQLEEKGINFWALDEKAQCLAYSLYLGHSREEAEEMWNEDERRKAKEKAPREEG